MVELEGEFKGQGQDQREDVAQLAETKQKRGMWRQDNMIQK